jgi:hypothetical protein
MVLVAALGAVHGLPNMAHESAAGTRGQRPVARTPTVVRTHRLQLLCEHRSWCVTARRAATARPAHTAVSAARRAAAAAGRAPRCSS